MNESPETLRQQLEETKSQLSEKLQALETQFKETVHSVRTAVNATATAVQATIETVNESMQGAAMSVRNAFDLRRQIDRHPWLVLGGSAALGCLAVEALAIAAKTSAAPSETVPAPRPLANDKSCRNGSPAAECEATVATGPTIAVVDESNRESSFRQQFRRVAVGTLTVIVQDIAALAVPKVMDYLTRKRANARINRSDHTEETTNQGH